MKMCLDQAIGNNKSKCERTKKKHVNQDTFSHTCTQTNKYIGQNNNGDKIYET